MMAGVSADPVNTCSISLSRSCVRRIEVRPAGRGPVPARGTLSNPSRRDDFDLIDTLAQHLRRAVRGQLGDPDYRVCQLARKHVTVALSGDGGDENFAGYRRYRLHAMEERLRNAMPLSVRRPAFGMLGRMYPKADWAPRVFRAKSTFQALARTSVDAYFHSVSILRDDMRHQLYSSAFKAQLGGYWASRSSAAMRRSAGTDDPLSGSSSTWTSRPTSSATSIRRSIARAWRIRSRCASR